jgi:hypothetical protein
MNLVDKYPWAVPAPDDVETLLLACIDFCRTQANGSANWLHPTFFVLTRDATGTLSTQVHPIPGESEDDDKQLALRTVARTLARLGTVPFAVGLVTEGEADGLPGISGRTTVLIAMARGIDGSTALQAALPVRRDRKGMFHKAGEVHRDVGRSEAIETLYEMFAEEDARLRAR